MVSSDVAADVQRSLQFRRVLSQPGRRDVASVCTCDVVGPCSSHSADLLPSHSRRPRGSTGAQSSHDRSVELNSMCLLSSVGHRRQRADVKGSDAAFPARSRNGCRKGKAQHVFLLIGARKASYGYQLELN